jgi:hypothetical protein
MIDSKFVSAIKIINQLLNENQISWALIGSTNMQLQGMNVNPRDLDIVIQLKDLEKIRSIFSSYTTSEIRKLEHLTDESAWEVKLDISGVEVQIVGERDTGKYAGKLLAKKLIHVTLEDIHIPCFTLDAAAQTYAETKREDKANLIKDFLKHH